MTRENLDRRTCVEDDEDLLNRLGGHAKGGRDTTQLGDNSGRYYCPYIQVIPHY